DVGSHTQDEPQGVIIEAAAHSVISTFSEGLVLMVRAAVLELSRCDVENTLASALGDQMHEAEQILVGVAEAHASTNAALKERSGARHVEGDHALVLIPDVHHAIEFVVA